MTIYVSHASALDYQTELYLPLRNSSLNTQHDFILPHESSLVPKNTRMIIEACDLVVAEVSHPSTGQGIELGWADVANKRIIGFYRAGMSPSSSVRIITDDIFEYSDSSELLNLLSHAL